VTQSPTARFRELIAREDADIPLAPAALAIAAHAYPELDVDAYVARLDELAAACPAATVDALVSHLFHDGGFVGNSEDYYDPRNSFLNDVLDRHTGLPITLSVVTIEVGHRLGLPLYGVGLPGHFVVGVDGRPVEYVDPYAGGARLDAAGCAEIVARVQPGLPFDARFLAPTGTRAILDRMLANLQAVYFSTDLAAARWVVDLRRAVPDRPPAERKHLAQALSALGRFDAAADELAAAGLEAEARSLRARTN